MGTPKQKVQIGYISLKEGEQGSLKDVFNHLVDANRARMAAINMLGRFPANMFFYYRTTPGLDENLQSCPLFQNELIAGTEMLKLPCGHAFAVRSLYDLVTIAEKDLVQLSDMRRGFACWYCRQGKFQRLYDDDSTTLRFNLMLASGGGQHLLDECIRWSLYQRPDQYHMAYERWFANGMNGPAPPLADASQPPLREDSQPTEAPARPNMLRTTEDCREHS